MMARMQLEDPRVRRTHMMIEKAFAELLQEKDFQSITVQDVASRAKVNRTTFYDHFTDKYALFQYSVQISFEQILESKLSADFAYTENNLQELIVILCEFVAQIDDRCRHKYIEGLPSFDEQVVDLLGEILFKWLEESGVASPALMPDVVSWAIYGAARHWSLRKPRQPVKDLAAQVVPLVLALIEQGKL